MHYTIIANLVSAAGAFGLTIIFSRSLHSEEFATIVVWSSLFSWGQFVVSLSSAGYVIRTIVTSGRDEGINSIVTIVHYVAFVSALGAAFWFCLDWIAELKLKEYNELFYFSCLLASLTAIQSAVTGYYRFTEDHRAANIIQLSFSVCTLIATFLLAQIGALVPADRVRIPAVAILIIFLLYKPGFGVIARRLKCRPVKEVIPFVRYSIGFIGHSAAHTIVGGLDRLVLNSHVSATELGNYHVIKQGAESLRIIAQAIQSQMSPKFLKFLHDGELARTKDLTNRFVTFVAGGALFSFVASIALFFLSGRGLATNILGLTFTLVTANAIYSIYNFRSLPWSLGGGHGLSARSVVVCTMYAIAVYFLVSRIDLTNISLTYLAFTIALLISTLLAPKLADNHDAKIK